MIDTSTFRSALVFSALCVAITGCGSSAPAMYDAKAPPPSNAPGVAYLDASGAGPATASKAGVAQQEAAPSPMASAAPDDRPGLGTQWGETRNSAITSVPFLRGDASSPFATGVIYYNDEQGAKAMASSQGFARTSQGLYAVANGALQLGIRDENGTWLTGFKTSDKNYVVGEAGHRYTIVVKNATPFRIECVLSVDGLDVLDGKAASFSKRGYIVDPRGEIEVDGFRQSETAVAAFRFGSVRGSYAELKTGDSSNVGVIGLAVFNERGTEPWKWNEIEKRHDANPFPGQYATPPGVAK